MGEYDILKFQIDCPKTDLILLSQRVQRQNSKYICFIYVYSNKKKYTKLNIEKKKKRIYNFIHTQENIHPKNKYYSCCERYSHFFCEQNSTNNENNNNNSGNNAIYVVEGNNIIITKHSEFAL